MEIVIVGVPVTVINVAGRMSCIRELERIGNVVGKGIVRFVYCLPTIPAFMQA